METTNNNAIPAVVTIDEVVAKVWLTDGQYHVYREATEQATEQGTNLTEYVGWSHTSGAAWIEVTKKQADHLIVLLKGWASAYGDRSDKAHAAKFAKNVDAAFSRELYNNNMVRNNRIYDLRRFVRFDGRAIAGFAVTPKNGNEYIEVEVNMGSGGYFATHVVSHFEVADNGDPIVTFVVNTHWAAANKSFATAQ